MRRGMMPLTALRSFEAAGRHLSFTKAAHELAVSQAAVSRQVRELETLLSLALFDRHHRRVSLTTAGARLHARLTEGFDLLAGALVEIRNERPLAVVRVTCDPTFAVMWLVPRLEAFRALRPDIDVVIDSDPTIADFRSSGCDIAIRCSIARTEWPRTRSRKLFECFDTPLMAPVIAASIEVPGDLAKHTLLHEDGREHWPAWFKAAGAGDVALPKGPLLPDGSFTVQAARMGQGIALMDSRFVADDLASGRLVRPFEIEIPHGVYWLVTPSFAKPTEAAEAFSDWLFGDVASLRAV